MLGNFIIALGVGWTAIFLYLFFARPGVDKKRSWIFLVLAIAGAVACVIGYVWNKGIG